MQHDINMTVTTLLPEELTAFENQLYADYTYYEGKYTNEETFKDQIISMFGCFPIEYILSEVQDYMRKRVYICALYQYIRENDL